MDPAAAVPHPLPEPLVEAVAARFRALAEPMRIRILDRLRDGAMTATELADALGTTQQNVSKHLGVLQRAGVVERRREAGRAPFAIADPGVVELCGIVCGSIRRDVAGLARALGG